MRSRLPALVLLILLGTFAWSQTPRPTATAAVEEEYVPSAKETDKPAVFGYMILSRRGEMAGTPTRALWDMSMLPWGLCVPLAGIYWWLTLRRGMRRPPAQIEGETSS